MVRKVMTVAWWNEICQRLELTDREIRRLQFHPIYPQVVDACQAGQWGAARAMLTKNMVRVDAEPRRIPRQRGGQA